jgi:hypothetical protein
MTNVPERFSLAQLAAEALKTCPFTSPVPSTTRPDPLDFGYATTLDPQRNPSGGPTPNPPRPDNVAMRWTAAGATLGPNNTQLDYDKNHPAHPDYNNSPRRDSPLERLPQQITQAEIAANADRYGHNNKFWSGKDKP